MRVQLFIGLVISLGFLIAASGVLTIGNTDPTAANTHQAVLSVGSGTIQVGEDTVVEVTAEFTGKIQSWAAIEVVFNPSVVTATGCESASLPTLFDNCDFETEIDSVAFTGEFVNAQEGTVTLGTITFHGESVGEAHLNLQGQLFAEGNSSIDDRREEEGTIMVLEGPEPTATSVGETPVDTPPPATGTQPLETTTGAPTSTPGTPGPETTTPGTPGRGTATPGAAHRDLTIEHKEKILVGEAAVIKVTVSRANVSVRRQTFNGGYKSIVDAPGDEPLEIYFKPPEPTFLELHVSAVNFNPPEYSDPGKVREIFRETPDVSWIVNLSPKSEALGEQRMTLTLTQSLPDERPIPPSIKTTSTSFLKIDVTAPGESRFDQTKDVLRWALPGGFASLIGVLALFNWRRIGTFINRRGSNDAE